MKSSYILILALLLFIRLMANASNSNHQLPETIQSGTKHSFDVLKYKLDIDLYDCYFSPFPKAFSASQKITIRVDSVLNTISLNAINTSLVIDSVRIAGNSFIHVNDTLKIRLDRIYKPGEILDIRIFYKHKDMDDNGFYAINGTVYTDSPPEGARKWMPCWDKPSDKATWELNARVPLTVRLGSTGRLADSTVSGNTINYHWISNIPVSTYLITISSKIKFNIHCKFWHKLNNNSDSVPIRIYYEAGENMDVIDTSIIPITDFFSQKFGDYPFEKIGFATMNSTFPWGGMENQSMVNLRPNGYGNISLIAHEHSHQWFGDMITCSTWADIWLNEGFGTYCQNLWLEHTSGPVAYKASMSSLADYYLKNNPGWPLYHPSWAVQTPSGDELYNQAISYNKGACVLYQLRYVMGDSLFFKLMHTYATDTNLIFKNASTQDFTKLAGQVANTDMKWFFDEWVYSPNHPVYQNTFSVDSVGINEWKVYLVINQAQTSSVIYSMPVQLRLSFTDGSHSIIQVMNNLKHQTYSFSFTKKPADLIFDPFRNILLKETSTIFLP